MMWQLSGETSAVQPVVWGHMGRGCRGMPVPGVPPGPVCRREVGQGTALQRLRLQKKHVWPGKVLCGCQDESITQCPREKISRVKGLEAYSDQHLVAVGWDVGTARKFGPGCD